MSDTRERADLLEALQAHRRFLRFTTRDLTEEQARQRTTPSELTLGGLIKHVARMEGRWMDFIEGGPDAMTQGPDAQEAHATSFQLLEGETLAGALDDYETAAARTDAMVMSLPDLDASQPLPEAPWFPPGATRSARRVFLHLIAETSQHAGHADIIREALDGQKTMG